MPPSFSSISFLYFVIKFLKVSVIDDWILFLQKGRQITDTLKNPFIRISFFKIWVKRFYFFSTFFYPWHSVKKIVKVNFVKNLNFRLIWKGLVTITLKAFEKNFYDFSFYTKHEINMIYKQCGNCSFPQNLHNRKLGEITVFFAQKDLHSTKNVGIRSFSVPYFPACGLNIMF